MCISMFMATCCNKKKYFCPPRQRGVVEEDGNLQHELEKIAFTNTYEWSYTNERAELPDRRVAPIDVTDRGGQDGCQCW